MYRMKKIIPVLVVMLLLISCGDEYKVPEEISNIEMEIEVHRFDQDFYNTPVVDFFKLKEKYPYMPDVNWENDKKDTLVTEMLQETAKAFPDFKNEKQDLELLFQHIKFYFPEFEKPSVITVTSGVDYRNKVLVRDSLLVVSLDTYLGSDHKYYSGFYKYIRKNLKKEQLVSDVSEAYAYRFVKPGSLRQYVEQMVYFGKVLYLQDQFLPFKAEASRIGYTGQELEWAKANEGLVWSYFIEENLLFSTESTLKRRFLQPGPFSKFGKDSDIETPARLGRYIGWQIVRSFMKKNDVSLRDLCLMSGEEIFNRSNYKPAR